MEQAKQELKAMQHPTNEYGTVDCPYFENDIVSNEDGSCPLCGEKTFTDTAVEGVV